MRKTTRALLLFALLAPVPAVLAIGAPAPALAQAAPAEVPGSAALFVAKAIIGGMSEIDLGQLAQEKAASAEVKQFAQRMVKDHKAANEKLLAEAKRLKVEPDGSYGTPPLKPDAEMQKTKQELSGLSGQAFDQAYMRHMIRDHEKDVALFREQAKEGKDDAVRGLAESALPTLEDHLKQARQVAAQVGVRG